MEAYFQSHYRASLDDVTITETPGYWDRKTLCGGRGVCRAPIHDYLFTKGPMRHTLIYFDPGRDPVTGRFASPTRTWRALRAEAVG